MPTRRAGLVSFLALSALVTVGASAGPAAASPPEVVGTPHADIIDGTDSTAAQNSVVLIVQPVGTNEQVNCSGTLVAPNLVMTARHCVSNTSDEGFSCDKNGVGTSGGDILSDVDPTTLYIFTGTQRATRFTEARAQGAKLFHDDGTNLCDHDLALILLDTSIDDIPPASIRLTGPPVVDESIVAVGWGVTTTALTPTTRQQRTVSIERVGPDRDDANQLDIPPKEFEVGESICQGDSGGPAFDATTGAVVGVVSRGGNDTTPNANDPAASCVGASNFYSELSNFQSTIETAFLAANATPTLETGETLPQSAAGADCVSDAECATSLCADATGSGTNICTYDCSTAACPSGFSCNSVDAGTAATEAKYCVADAPKSGGCSVSSTGASGSGSSTGSRDGMFSALFAAAFAFVASRTKRRRVIRTAR